LVEIGSKSKGHLVMTTIRDMSYWLELERQKTSSALKTIAFASAAHEFRNPLNGVLISLQLMGSETIDSETSCKYY
jgi:signal transduction histidine kinase